MTEELKIEEVEEVQENKEYKRKPKYKRKRVIIPVIFVIIGIILGLKYYIHAIKYVSTNDAFIEGHIVSISSKIPGSVLKIYVDDNQKVNKGYLLAEIDSRDYKAKYEQTAAKPQETLEKLKSASINVNLTSVVSGANLEQAHSGIEAAKSGIQVADKQIAQNKANLAQIEAEIEAVKTELDLAKSDLSRYQKLYKQDFVSKQDLDRIFTNYKAVNAKLNSGLEKASAAKAAIQSAYANKDIAVKYFNQAMAKFKSVNTIPQLVSISDSQRKAVNAEIKQLRASVNLTELELSYAKIYAPQSGSVISKSVEEGTYVQIGQPLMSIIPEKVWIIANFKETQLKNIKINQPVNIKIDTYPNKIFKGHVNSIQSSTGSKTSLFPPENGLGSFVKVVQRIPVKIVFDEKIESKYTIVPGMSVIPEVKIK
ncbi:MAG: HlyD family secretion protein [bacterium]